MTYAEAFHITALDLLADVVPDPFPDPCPLCPLRWAEEWPAFRFAAGNEEPETICDDCQECLSLMGED